MTDQGRAMGAGEACLRGLLITAFAAVPTALRASGAGGSFWGGLVVGAAMLLPLIAVSIVLFRAAGRGLRGVFGKDAGTVAAFGIALWIGLSTAALAGLSGWLKATTHHRGLGGATFGVLGLVAVAACALCAYRLVRAGQWLVTRGLPPWVVAALGAACAVVPVLVVAAPLTRAPAAPGASEVAAAIIDGSIVLVASALVASLDLGASLRRLAGRFGLAAALVLITAGLLWAERSASLGHAIRAGGGLPATILGALERWTDRDQDGVGAHFGGHDCDEGDPLRHPGAVDTDGDGIDQDCDGTDGVGMALGRTAGSTAPPDPADIAAEQAAAAAPVSASPPQAPQPPPRLDIILVTLDTVRADHTSVYGYSRDTTPHLQALAAKAVVFDHAYATGSDTQHALAPLVSGQHLEDTARDRRTWPTILAEVDTVAERMARAGYVTAAVTSFTWLSEERGFAQGFERFQPVYTEAHPERSVTGALATAAAKRILGDLVTEARPIFLWVHLFDAHARYLDHPGGIHFGKGRTARYDGEIAFVDQQLGALTAAISNGPRAARTAWIVHGSHGEGLGEHDRLGHGSELYEEVIHVPLVVALPDGRTGRHDSGVVSTLDVVKTVLELAGAPVEGVAGTSLLPAVRGDTTPRYGPAFSRAPRRAAVIDWPLKLIVMERKRSRKILLFDLESDPGEARNLSESRPADTTRLLQLAGMPISEEK